MADPLPNRQPGDDIDGTARTRRALALIAGGMSVRDAAKQAGVSPSTITRAKARAGMPAGKPGRRPTKEKAE